MRTVITWGLSDEENRELAAEGAALHEVFTADGLFHATEFVEAEAVAVVFLDRSDGPLVEILERFTSDRPRVDLIVVVPAEDSEIITRAYEAGARRVTVGQVRSISRLGLSKELPGAWLSVEATPAQVWVQ